MLRGSSVTPVWRAVTKVASTTRWAAAKAAATSPFSAVRVKQRLSPSAGWITTAPGASAVSMSSCAGSGCQSTASAATPSSAAARLSATTATTGSPCQVARSSGSGYCGADFMPFR